MSGIALYQRGDDLLYSQEKTERTNQRILELLDDLSSQGLSVVLDAIFGEQEFLKKLINGLVQKNVVFEICTMHYLWISFDSEPT